MGVAAAVAAVSEAVKQVFVFLCTPQGAALVNAWIKGADNWNKVVGDIGTWIVASVKDLIPQKHV